MKRYRSYQYRVEFSKHESNLKIDWAAPRDGRLSICQVMQAQVQVT